MGCLNSKPAATTQQASTNSKSNAEKETVSKQVEIVNNVMNSSAITQGEDIPLHDDDDDDFATMDNIRAFKIRFDDADSDDEYKVDEMGNSIILDSSPVKDGFSGDENTAIPKSSAGYSSADGTTSEARDSVDVRGSQFTTEIEFADQTLKLLQSQLKNKGIVPLEFIPLPKIKAEMAALMEAANRGEPFDDARLDYLLSCMELNPEYQAEKEAEANKWREEVTPFISECLATMRAYIPPSIFSCSVDSLVDDYGYSRELAKRVFTKKCLWLVRIAKHDLERIHEAELTGRFNPMSQGLDIIETTAIFASLPAKFTKDPTGKKEQWRLNIEKNMKDLYKQYKDGTLLKIKQRSLAYKNQAPQFTQRETLHEMRSVSSEGSLGPRMSHLSIGKASTGGGMSEIDSDRLAAISISDKSKITQPISSNSSNSSNSNDNNSGINRDSTSSSNGNDGSDSTRDSTSDRNSSGGPRVKSVKHAAFASQLNGLFANKEQQRDSLLKNKDAE